MFVILVDVDLEPVDAWMGRSHMWEPDKQRNEEPMKWRAKQLTLIVLAMVRWGLEDRRSKPASGML